MRIENIYALQGVNRPMNNIVREKADRTAGNRDAYTPSSLATDFNLARRAAADVPDIRDDIVNDIISRIEAGRYNISADDVARKIVDQIG